MASLNKVMLIGSLGNDPELKGKEGKEVTNFSLATKDTRNPEAKPEWHRIVAFGKLAVTMTNHLKKGSAVYLEGRLQTRKFEKDSQDHFITEIIVKEFQFI